MLERTERDDGVPAQGLLDERVDVGHGPKVVKRRQAVGADHLVELVPGALLHFGVEHHGEEERVQCRCDLPRRGTSAALTGRATYLEFQLTVSEPPDRHIGTR